MESLCAHIRHIWVKWSLKWQFSKKWIFVCLLYCTHFWSAFLKNKFSSLESRLLQLPNALSPMHFWYLLHNLNLFKNRTFLKKLQNFEKFQNFQKFSKFSKKFKCVKTDHSPSHFQILIKTQANILFAIGKVRLEAQGR